MKPSRYGHCVNTTNTEIPKYRNTEPPTTAAELDGYVGLGMKKDALRLARRHLKDSAVNLGTFCASVDAILTLADATKPWRPLVDAAYQKLDRRGQKLARSVMLCFYSSAGDTKAAYTFIPRRFSGPTWSIDLMFTIDILLDLGRIEEARPYIRKAVATVDSMVEPEGKAMMKRAIAAYLTKIQQWEPAIRLWEEVSKERLLTESGIFGLIELHLQRALETIASARKTLEHFRNNPDPDLETIIHGNDTARWQETETKLTRLHRHLSRALKTAAPTKGQPH